MKVIGLSGGIGSGKSTVSYYLSTLDIPVFSADAAFRAAVEKGSPCLPDIIALLGTDCLLEDGGLNRALASEKVFRDRNLLQKFETILQKQARAEEQHFQEALSQLPRYWRPKYCLRIEHLPMTETGKPARKEAMRIVASNSTL